MLITLVCEDIRHKVMLDYTIIIITVAIAGLHMKLPGSGHVGGQEQKQFSSLGTKLRFHKKFCKKMSSY